MTKVRVAIDRTTRGYPFLVKEHLNENDEVLLSAELTFVEADSLNYNLEEYFEEAKNYLVTYSQDFGTYSEESSLDRRESYVNIMSFFRYLENYLQPKWALEWQLKDAADI
jgi:hypothetical protein